MAFKTAARAIQLKVELISLNFNPELELPLLSDMFMFKWTIMSIEQVIINKIP